MFCDNTDEFIILLGENGEYFEYVIYDNITLYDIKVFIINSINNIDDIDSVKVYFGNYELEENNETLEYYNIQIGSYLNFKCDSIKFTLKIHNQNIADLSGFRKYSVYFPIYDDVFSNIKKILGYENISNDILNMTIYNETFTEKIYENEKVFEDVENCILNITFIESIEKLNTWGLNLSANILKNYLVPKNELVNTPFPSLNGLAYFWHNWHTIVDNYILNIWNTEIIKSNKIINNKVELDKIEKTFKKLENNDSSIYINFITLYRQKYNNTNHTLELIDFYDIMKELIIINKENKNITDTILFHNIYKKSPKPWQITPNQESYKFEGLIYKKL